MKTITEILAEIDKEIMLEATTEPMDYRLVKYITSQIPYYCEKGIRKEAK